MAGILTRALARSCRATASDDRANDREAYRDRAPRGWFRARKRAVNQADGQKPRRTLPCDRPRDQRADAAVVLAHSTLLVRAGATAASGSGVKSSPGLMKRS